MFVHHHGMGNGQPVSGSLSNLFCGKERIEYFRSGLLWNARASVADAYLYRIINSARCHSNSTLRARLSTGRLADSVSSVDDHIQDHLVELARETEYLRQARIKICDHLGYISPFTLGHRDCCLNGFVDVGRRFLCNVRMRELFHGPNYLANALNAFQTLLHGPRHLLFEERQVRLLLDVLNLFRGIGMTLAAATRHNVAVALD